MKAINLFPRGNPFRGMSGPIIDSQRFRYGDDCHFSIQGLCQSNPLLNAYLATTDPSALKRILALPELRMLRTGNYFFGLHGF